MGKGEQFIALREWAWEHPLSRREDHAVIAQAKNQFAVLQNGTIRIAMSLNR